MSKDESQPSFYRCPVAADRAAGSLKVGRCRIPIKVVDTSIEGFTVTVAKKHATRLRHDRTWTLITQDEQSVVHPEWMFNAANGDAQLGVRRIKDVTPQEMPRGRWLPFGGTPKDATSDRPGMALGGMLMLIVAILCLPGVGDDLGTAPLVRSALRETLQSVGMSVRQFLNS